MDLLVFMVGVSLGAILGYLMSHARHEEHTALDDGAKAAFDHQERNFSHLEA